MYPLEKCTLLYPVPSVLENCTLFTLYPLEKCTLLYPLLENCTLLYPVPLRKMYPFVPCTPYDHIKVI